MALRATYDIAIIFIIFLLFSPVSAMVETGSGTDNDTIPPSSQTAPYRIELFIPSPNQIHSDQIMDQINDLNGDVLFATAFGLSTFNGTWNSRHINRDNISQGLMDDFITAIEIDNKGNLWIGYSGGIQIYNRVFYRAIREQELLKDTRIHDLQRWNDDMWISTGNSGIHRYRDGVWTWFQPMTRDGPGFYEIDSMALDTKSNSLVIATENEGLWIIRNQTEPVHFEMLAEKNTAAGLMQHVKRDPLGGVYFYNPQKIIHFDTASGFNDILTTRELTQEQITINDIAAGSDGNLYVATDDGLYIWRDSGIYRHLNRFEGIGTSEIVMTVNVDADKRVWFATQGNVGYYMENMNPEKQLTIEMVTPTASLIPITIINVSSTNPNPSIISAISPVSESSSLMNIVTRITDPIIMFINSITQKFGITILP